MEYPRATTPPPRLLVALLVAPIVIVDIDRAHTTARRRPRAVAPSRGARASRRATVARAVAPDNAPIIARHHARALMLKMPRAARSRSMRPCVRVSSDRRVDTSRTRRGVFVARSFTTSSP
jgi:hypothetical protein